jgi:phosphoglycolate phosphatase
MRGIELVIYDLDGTLIETAPEICDALNDTLEHFGWPAVGEDQVARWIGHGTGALLRQAVAGALAAPPESVDADRMASVGTVYDRCYARRCGTRSRLYPDAARTLEAQRRAGLRLAIVTNKESRYTERVLEVHALTGAFDTVIAGDTLPTKKPDPAGIQACLTAHDVPRERAVFIGDSAVDAATARNAGVPAWLFPHGYNMGQPIESVDADRVLPDFATLLRELDEAGPPRATARAARAPAPADGVR